jgi:hypothetical protein
MPDVIELRVHGVGGGSPEGLLGEPTAGHTVRVDGDDPAGFYARRSDRSIEGYWWGRLTGAAAVQPLWIVLLPFTLLNVAGWMHQPLVRWDRVTWRWWASRIVLWALGAVMTAIYAAWTALLMVDHVAVQWRWGGRFSTDVSFWLGAGASAVALGVVIAVARHVQNGYEGVEPPGAVRRAETDGPGSSGGLDERFAGERRLDRPTFWSQSRGTTLLLWAHAVLAIAVLAVFVAVGAGRLGDATLGYGPILRVLLQLGLALLVALLVIDLLELRAVGFPSPRHSDPDAVLPSGFRCCGPTVAATTGFALAAGAFTGLELALGRWLDTEPGVELLLDGAFGVATVAVAVAAVVWLGWHVRVGLRQRAAVDEELQRQRPHPPLAPTNLAGRVAMARAFSDGLRNLDLVLTVPVAVFLPVGVYSGLVTPPPPLSGGAVATLGRWILLIGIVGALGFLWREGRDAEGRRRVGTLWDVLTFWPRRFHPLGVRPYAERAVPQLQHRVCDHLDRGRCVIVSAHSQGAVLAVAALAPLPEIDGRVMQRVALVTYGSPVTQLYQRFFPAYFDPSFLLRLRKALHCDERDATAGWRNFFRRTDYIGKRMFNGEHPEGCDVEVHDPAIEPAIDGEPLDAVFPNRPDPCRVAFTTLALHSGYNREVALRSWVTTLRRRLERVP